MVWLLVGAGGALGSIARHGLNRLVHQGHLESSFPLGIFLVNVSGSAAIGVLGGVIASGRLELSFEARTFLIVGVLGGFTTFSSFGLDSLALIRGGHLGQAIWNVVGQVGLSLIGVAWIRPRQKSRRDVKITLDHLPVNLVVPLAGQGAGLLATIQTPRGLCELGV